MNKVSETLKGFWSALRTCARSRRDSGRAETPRFQCEPLEPRLLLSGDWLSGGSLSLAPLQDDLDQSVIMVELNRDEPDKSEDALEQKEVLPVSTNTDTSADTDMSLEVDLQGPIRDQQASVVLHTETFTSNSINNSEASSAVVADVNDNNYWTQKSTQMLLAPNPPPALTGNDSSEVTIKPFSFDLTTGLNDITLYLKDINGTDVLQIIDATGEVQAEQALSGTSEIIITGLPWQDDTLTIDFGGGTMPVPITFHGGDGGFDSLIITGGSFSEAIYGASGPDSGTITLDDTIINYTGLEPITDNNNVADRVFTITTTGVDQQIRITDYGDPDNGVSIIDSNGTA